MATQKEFDDKRAEYMEALYQSPRDEHKCHALALELLEMAKGTRLEERQRMVVERHAKRL